MAHCATSSEWLVWCCAVLCRHIPVPAGLADHCCLLPCSHGPVAGRRQEVGTLGLLWRSAELHYWTCSRHCWYRFQLLLGKEGQRPPLTGYSSCVQARSHFIGVGGWTQRSLQPKISLPRCSPSATCSAPLWSGVEPRTSPVLRCHSWGAPGRAHLFPPHTHSCAPALCPSARQSPSLGPGPEDTGSVARCELGQQGDHATLKVGLSSSSGGSSSRPLLARPG